MYSVEEKKRVRILTPELKWVIFMLFCVTDEDLNFFCILRRVFKHRKSLYLSFSVPKMPFVSHTNHGPESDHVV